MPAEVLYFHGFASSPKSEKLVRLARLLDSEIVFNAPDLNVPTFQKLQFAAMVRLGLDEARRRPPKAIVGSSLGSLVALELVGRGIAAPLVLIAPAVGVGRRWHSRLPEGDPLGIFHYAAGGEVPIHRAFFDEMNQVEPERLPPPVPVSVIMGREDETVPFSMVRSVWEAWTAAGQLVQGSRFIEIAGGDHGLVDFVEVIAREIRAASGFHAF